MSRGASIHGVRPARPLVDDPDWPVRRLGDDRIAGWNRIADHLPGLDAADSRRVQRRSPAACSSSSPPTLTCLHVEAHGGGDPESALRRFTEPLAWSVLDDQTGDWLDDTDGSNVTAFCDYRDRVLDEPQPPPPSSEAPFSQSSPIPRSEPWRRRLVGRQPEVTRRHRPGRPGPK